MATYVFVRSIKRSFIDHECRDPVSIMNVPLPTLKSKRKDWTLRVLHAQIQMKKILFVFWSLGTCSLLMST